jgi:pimeloyl-ACP methyl ester carboxylesterase
MKLAELVGIARPLEVARHGLVQRLDYIAARGYDVYLLDLRGYGKSARPKEMSEDPKTNPPIVRGDTAVKDIGTVVDFILARRNIQRLNLIGWSWGTVTMSTYSTQNPSKVKRLILYAPGWIRQTASLVCHCRPADELWNEHHRRLSTSWQLRRSNGQRSAAERPTGCAADEI